MNIGARFIGKSVSYASRKLGKGEGSVLPGRAILMLDKNWLRSARAKMKRGCIFITGTNGKSTTTYYLVRALRSLGYLLATNLSGANMRAGLASALLDLRDEVDYGVFEVDEGALPSLILEMKPSHLIVLNFSRDQLDRYTEIEALTGKIIGALKQEKVEVIYNAGNLHALTLGQQVADSSSYLVKLPESNEGLDRPVCFNCQQGLLNRDQNDQTSVVCQKCDFRFDQVTMVSQFGGGILKVLDQVVGCPTPELADTLTATALIASKLNIEAKRIVAVLSRIPPLAAHEARYILPRHEAAVNLVLAKNPDSFNRILRRNIDAYSVVLLAVNRQYADGLDTSWLWDVEFESLSKFDGTVAVTGEARPELSLRLKVAGVSRPVIIKPSTIIKYLSKPGREVLVIANYTAYRAIERQLSTGRSLELKGEERHEEVDTCLPVV